MEETGCEIVCGAPTTLAVKGLIRRERETLWPTFTSEACTERERERERDGLSNIVFSQSAVGLDATSLNAKNSTFLIFLLFG